jgi:acyl-CoA thioester hydrolase
MICLPGWMMTTEQSDLGPAHARLEVRVYYEDTDTSGIVYHANYLRFIERGRTELLRSFGLNHRELLDGPAPLAFAVRRMSLSFERPAHIDDLLIVETWVVAVSGARLTMHQHVLDDQGTTLFAADVEIACLSPDGKPKRLPEAARRGFEAVTLRHTTPP